MGVVVVDYGAGNGCAVINALRRAGADALVSDSASMIEAADRLVIAGVGAFDPAMRFLRERSLMSVLNRKVLEDKVPVLGICLGMQIMGHSSEEGSESGMGWVDARSVRFRGMPSSAMKVPHVGWNTVRVPEETSLLSRANDGEKFYFLHSFHLVCANKTDVAAYTEYGQEFVSAICRGNIMGAQFHPEKSQNGGVSVFRRFLELS